MFRLTNWTIGIAIAQCKSAIPCTMVKQFRQSFYFRTALLRSEGAIPFNCRQNRILCSSLLHNLQWYMVTLIWKVFSIFGELPCFEDSTFDNLVTLDPLRSWTVSKVWNRLVRNLSISFYLGISDLPWTDYFHTDNVFSGNSVEEENLNLMCRNAIINFS